ncbi:MAG TPA: hypothetical protein VMD74_01075 [Candidatus Methylomirabilis sp.]|nr:hypothetical protein [Candidatus Methylomirabilis sp.]
MVKELKQGGKTWYQCEVCGHNYEDGDWAEKCEDWCNDHDDANPEITAYSVKME